MGTGKMKNQWIMYLGAGCLLVVTGVLGQGLTEGECQFTKDCEKVQRCKNIQDASCICKFGKCVYDGNPFFRGNECDNYKDCACRGSPATCFCRNGLCKSDPVDKFECHESADCKSLSKCSGKSCTCQGNLCEFHCKTVNDCVKGGFFCATLQGYKCKCEKSLCELEKLPSECTTIQDCVKKGKCADDKPCACTNDQCVDPWYVETSWFRSFPTKTCRDASDCDYSIARCQNNKCDCINKVKVNQYESFGECVLAPPPPPPKGFAAPPAPPQN